MTGTAGPLATANANVEYVNYGSEIFNRPMGGPFEEFCQIIPCDGRGLELDAIGPSPAVEELIGSRRYAAFREFARQVPVKPYSTKAIDIPRLRVEKDPTGLTAQRLRDYLDAARDFWDKPITDVFLSNPTCMDGSALLSDSHPYASGGSTWDNKTTDTLSQSSLKTGIVAMTSLLNEEGEPMGISPTHLMVGPKWEREALDLTGAMRGVPYSNAGAPDASASVVAAVYAQNWLHGRLKVIVNPRMVGSSYEDDWFLMDLSKPGVRPLVAGEAIAPAPFISTSADSEAMRERSSYVYWVEGYAAITGGVPHVIYGRRGS